MKLKIFGVLFILTSSIQSFAIGSKPFLICRELDQNNRIKSDGGLEVRLSAANTENSRPRVWKPFQHSARIYQMNKRAMATLLKGPFLVQYRPASNPKAYLGADFKLIVSLGATQISHFTSDDKIERPMRCTSVDE